MSNDIYSYELNEADGRYDIYSGVNVVGSADSDDYASLWVAASNHHECPTVESIRAAASSLRMKLLGVFDGRHQDEVHEAQQYLYIAHALLQQVECNLILGNYALRKAVK